ncbi:MAG: 16S rRNA (adenine(1518)-N(6)/adenine(1519)-N(6))-dimethyltransferase RsmA [Verrucomicrobiae bacterium]|nr:16S rRNA (adenine(1518)-N(6)/adenine(1519)-N(6))-dimethyltransferase RsmA [Verrucomicrobiae bacterium]
MTLTEIRAHLRELDLRPSRQLGQNFLHDQNLARRIVEYAELKPGQPVIEIGPGLGALTGQILALGIHPVLFEKDSRLAGFLRQRHPQIQIVEGDAMEELPARRDLFSHPETAVIGNLPYSIASPLIVLLAEADLRPQQMAFTVQKEVARRIVAPPGNRDYGLLTLLIQPFYETRIAHKLPPGVFWPPPQVDSALVVMKRRHPQPFTEAGMEKHYRQILRQAWQQRRKKLGTIFRDNLPPALDANKRPEQIPPALWVEAALSDPGRGEWFDVVDEKDSVVGREKRAEVHRRGLRHRAVHVFLWNHRGELLLQKRSLSKDTAPGLWDSSAAGHLDAGETCEEAAPRECREETGVSPALSEIFRLPACEELGWEFVRLYEGKSEGPFCFPESEISELRWWTVQDIERTIAEKPGAFAGSFRHLWQRYRRRENP